jgi:TetR/AcrR family transcriptional regulator, cholesterol catabolism regulator
MATTKESSAVALLERWRALDQKSLQRMEGLARVGARLFGDRGYLNVTMDDVATEGGVSKGGVYHYFQTKAEILFFIVNMTIDDLLRGLPEELYIAAPGRERIRLVMKRQLDYYYGHLYEVKTLLNDRKLLTREFLQLVDLKEQRYFRLVETEVAHMLPGADAGKLAAVTFAFFGLCNWIPSWYRPGGPLGIDEIRDINFSIFMDGLGSLAVRSQHHLEEQASPGESIG